MKGLNTPIGLRERVFMGLILLKNGFLDEIDWKYKRKLLRKLKVSRQKEKAEIRKLMGRLNYLGEVGVDIQHKPSQFSFSSYGSVFKLRQRQETEPQLIKGKITFVDNTIIRQDIPHKAQFYVYKTNLYIFEAHNVHNTDEQKLMIKGHYFKNQKSFEKLKTEVGLFEKWESGDLEYSREPIPEDVRFAVWRRDGGKCVKCGSQKKLEFDHIIPVSKGGSNTERNIQLLCEHCNREKSDKI